MAPEVIFKSYARSIGIGGIAMSGIIGIVKSWGIIKGAVGLAAREMKGKGSGQDEVLRTQRDISFKIIAFGSIATLIITFLFFYFGVMNFNLLHAVVGILLVTIIAFLFTTVAAKCHCNRWKQPCIRYDADDTYPCFCRHGGCWTERERWYVGSLTDGWRCMYGPLYGRLVHYRLKDRLLAWYNT